MTFTVSFFCLFDLFAFDSLRRSLANKNFPSLLMNVVGVADDATLSEGNATHQQNFVQMKSNYNDTQNVTFWNAASNICANAIKSIEFQLTYNTFGKITKAVAEVETFDVALSDVLVEQHFSVQFLPENDTSIVTNSESNSTVTRVRSGNPGYLMEAPTLAAQLVSPNDDANFVNDMVEGITTFVPVGEGLCDVALPKRMV